MNWRGTKKEQWSSECDKNKFLPWSICSDQTYNIEVPHYSTVHLGKISLQIRAKAKAMCRAAQCPYPSYTATKAFAQKCVMKVRIWKMK